MESEAPFDKYMRRASAIAGLAITLYMVTLLPPVKQRVDALHREASYKVHYALRWMRNQWRMPWEKELIGETEELRRVVLPQPKPEWYNRDD